MQRLVARTGRPQFEFVDAIARETGVRVAVHESGDGAEAATVQLLDLALGLAQARAKLSHRAERGDSSVFAQHVRVADDLDIRERRTPERCLAARGCRKLREIADEQRPLPAVRVAHSAA